MRAVCFVVRNRRMAGWGDGTWLSILESAHHVAAKFNYSIGDQISDGKPALSQDRLLQLIVRDVDDIYLGQEPFDDRVRQVVCADPKKPVLYYSFVNATPRPWFVENIVRQPGDHPQVGNIGPMMLFR